MKIVCITYNGFRKVLDMDFDKPVIELTMPPTLKLGANQEPTETVTLDRYRFYYEREFQDENDEQVKIYREIS